MDVPCYSYGEAKCAYCQNFSYEILANDPDGHCCKFLIFPLFFSNVILQLCILTDLLAYSVQGNKVQATAFQGDIEGIDQRLVLHSTYLISNAYVKRIANIRFCVDAEYPYVWSFTRRTLIRDVAAQEGEDFRQLAEVDITAFTDMYAAYIRHDRISKHLCFEYI
ncbi:unnamed protein product, partial [Cuscuta epithymum]